MTRLHENADVSTGVLEVVDYNSESFYLNEDDDVSPSIISLHVVVRGQLVLAWRVGLLNDRLRCLYRRTELGFCGMMGRYYMCVIDGRIGFHR